MKCIKTKLYKDEKLNGINCDIKSVQIRICSNNRDNQKNAGSATYVTGTSFQRGQILDPLSFHGKFTFIRALYY